MPRDKKLQQLYHAIQRNDPAITTVDATSNERAAGWITLGRALLGTHKTYNTHITSLQVSADQIVAKPNNPRTSQYVYEFIHTSATLRKFKLLCKLNGSRDIEEQQCISKVCHSISLKPDLQEVRLHNVHACAPMEIPIGTITHLVRTTSCLKVMILEKVHLCLESSSTETGNAPWMYLAEAVSRNQTLEHFKMQYIHPWDDTERKRMDLFTVHFFLTLAPALTRTKLQNLELYCYNRSSMPLHVAASVPFIDLTLFTVLTRMTSVRHFGLSLDFMTLVTVRSFLHGLKTAASNQYLKMVTLDCCQFSREASASFLQFFHDNSNLLELSLLKPRFESDAFTIMKELVSLNVPLKELDMESWEGGQDIGNETSLNGFFQKLYEAAITPLSGNRHCTVGLPLESFRVPRKMSSIAVNYFALALPYLTNLQKLCVSDCSFTSRNPGPVVSAIRANASLQTVQVDALDSSLTPQIQSCITDKIKAYCQRNQLLWQLVVGKDSKAIGSKFNCYCNVENHHGNGLEHAPMELFPNIFGVAQQTLPMRLHVIFAGLLLLGNYSFAHHATPKHTFPRMGCFPFW